MAKPARVKKNKEAAPSRKKGVKTAAQGKVKEAPDKGKVKEASAKGKDKTSEKAKPKSGLRGRVSRAPKAQPKGKSKAAGPKENRTFKFFREVRVELSKVTWPTREELIQSTIVVVIAVVIAGSFIALWDIIFSDLISYFTG